MTDLERFDLRGPVQSVRSQKFLWSARSRAWEPNGQRNLTVFRPDGNVSYSGLGNASRYRVTRRYDSNGKLLEIALTTPNGTSRTQFQYDSIGRLVESSSVDTDGRRTRLASCKNDGGGRRVCVFETGSAALPPSDEVDEVSQSVDDFAPIERSEPPLTTTLIFDSANRPLEVLTYTATHLLRTRATFSRDGEGRMLAGEVTYENLEAFLEQTEWDGTPEPPERRRERRRWLQRNTLNRTLFTRTFKYDDKGRLVESAERRGTYSEKWQTFRYDNFGSVIETSTSHSASQAGKSGSIALGYQDRETLSYTYRYDRRGNWTKRVTTSTIDGHTRPHEIFSRSITYFEGAPP